MRAVFGVVPLLLAVCSAATSRLTSATSKRPDFRRLDNQQQCDCIDFDILEVATPGTQIILGTGTGAFGDLQPFRNNIFYADCPDVVIGHDQGSCIFTLPLVESTQTFENECEFTFVLDQDPNEAAGSFTVTGQFADYPTDLAIVGGTGRFEGAFGHATQSTQSGQENVSPTYLYEVHLCLPNCNIRQQDY